MSGSQDTYSIDFTMDDPSCTAFVKQILSSVDLNGNIQSIGVTIESTEPFEIEQSGLGVDGSRDNDTTHESSNSSPTEMRSTFRTNANTWAVIKMFYDRRDEGFLETSDVIQFVPDSAGIPDGSISSICWDLANRGFVEKKDHNRDGRKNVYKITNKGIDAVTATMENTSD